MSCLSIVHHPRVLLSGTGIHEASPDAYILDFRPTDFGNDDTTFRHPRGSIRGSMKPARIQTEWIFEQQTAGLQGGHTTNRLDSRPKDRGNDEEGEPRE